MFSSKAVISGSSFKDFLWERLALWDKERTSVFTIRHSCCSSEIPSGAREPFINTHYRPVGINIKDCVKSLFQFHNETVNIWTHIFAAFYFVSVLYRDMSDCWESREKFANLIPNFTFAFCLVLCFLASAFAHLFNCISVEVRKFVFVIDYTGVGLNALGAGISYTAYMPEDFIPTGSRNIYSVMMVIMVWLATIGCSVAMVYLSDRPVAQPLKAVSFGTIAIQGNVPMVAYLHHLSSTDSNSAALVTQYFWYYFLFKLIAGFFLASCIPEKLSPSKFDLFGHSHQLFHVAGFLCLNFQYKLGHSLASINPVESLETRN